MTKDQRKKLISNLKNYSNCACIDIWLVHIGVKIKLNVAVATQRLCHMEK